MNDEINEMDRKLTNYEIIVSIWRRTDESYWTSVNMFILIEGLLLAGYSQLIDTGILLLSVYCIAGILIGLIWPFVLNRKMAFSYIAEEVGRDLEVTTYPYLDKGGFFMRSKKIFFKKKYLFSIDTKFEGELNNGIISEELKKEFEKSGFSLPDNAAVKKKKEKKWAITDEKKFIIRKEEGKLNIYKENNDKQWLKEYYNGRAIFAGYGSSCLMSILLPFLMVGIWGAIWIVTCIELQS